MSWQKVCARKEDGGLGFRELYQFNISMLAKTGWNLPTRPEALVSKLFQARYYQQSNFLHAELGSNPSYVWRSLCAGKQILKQGCLRRIGDGKTTRVYVDPWLPKENSSYVESPSFLDSDSLLVKDLMKQDAKEWDVHLLRTLFNDVDMEAARQIPLAIRPRGDTWMWKLDNKGLYSVKSGYRLLYNQNITPNSQNQQLWKFLWSMSLPPKVLNFIWRALKNILPTCENLSKKKCVASSICPRCLQASETVKHCLVDCHFAKQCWIQSNLGWHRILGDFVTWFEEQRKSNTKLKMEETVIILWSLWEARNNLCWNNKPSTPAATLHHAKKELEEWRSANLVVEIPAAITKMITKWERPAFDIMKCNTDASYDIHTGLAGIGMVLRDHLGQFIAGKSVFLGHVASPLLAEITGVREALIWLQVRFSKMRLVVETDNLLVKQALEENLTNYSYFDSLAFDCKTLMKELPFLSLSIVKKSANQVAHCLARASVSMSGSMEWDTNPPSLITDVLSFDLNNT